MDNRDKQIKLITREGNTAHNTQKDMKEKLLEAMNAGISEGYLLIEYTGCTNLDEFCEAMLSLVREKKIRRSEVTGYYEII